MERRFGFKKEWYEATANLPDNLAARILEASSRFVFNTEDTRFENEYEQAIWILIRSQLRLNPTAEPSREFLSKKHRYMILERDNFTCQYCGAKAPDVQLHVDHIHPVAKGGTNDPSNLITACADCNSGKRAHVIGEERRW